MAEEGEVGDMEVEATEVEVAATEVAVEAMEVEGDQAGTIAMEERAEKVMHCSLAAASVALFVGSCTKEISVCAIFAQKFS